MSCRLDKELIKRYAGNGECIAVALSGGADSVCLLHLLCEYASEVGYSLIAVHVNHHIRGAEADRDAEFCRELCKRLGVGFFLEHRDVPSYAKESGLSLEEAARNARYDAFERVMRENDVHVIATAHNADDLAETLIIRLTRGASLDGLTGIPRERALSFGTVIRPILGTSKREIIAYCKENSLDYVIDSTNLSDDYVRNKIRNKVIPVLEEINPSFLKTVLNSTELLYRDSEYLKKKAHEVYMRSTEDGSLSCKRLENVPDVILSRVIGAYCSDKGASPEKKHIDALVAAVREKRDTVMSVPKCRRVTLKDAVITVGDDVRKRRIVPNYCFEIHEGENVFTLPECNLDIKATLLPATENGVSAFEKEKYSLRQSLIYNLSTHKALNFDTINGMLFLRNRRDGDRIVFSNMSKSVRRLMSEKRVPEELRDAIPCLTDGNEILYVPTVADAWRCSMKNKKSKPYILSIELNYNKGGK